jgi:hypothetical protein
MVTMSLQKDSSFNDAIPQLSIVSYATVLEAQIVQIVLYPCFSNYRLEVALTNYQLFQG